MKLYGRYLSPFVRRVGVTMQTQGLSYDHDEIAIFDDWERAQSVNPVVRIPALELDDGDVLIDSNFIIDHLDEAAGDKALIPASGKPRREVMKLVATAVGAMEKTVAAVYEGRFRAAEKVEDSWVERCDNQALSALKALDAKAAEAGDGGYLYGDGMTQADVSAVVAYGFAKLTRPDMNLAAEVPHLTKLADRLEATPAFQNTRP